MFVGFMHCISNMYALRIGMHIELNCVLCVYRCCVWRLGLRATLSYRFANVSPCPFYCCVFQFHCVSHQLNAKHVSTIARIHF